MGEVNHRMILIVTLGILAVSFFSHGSTLSTGQVTAAGSDVYTCKDYYNALSYYKNERGSATYDLSGDGVLDEEDLMLLYQRATETPCDLPGECTEEGRTYCNYKGTVVVTCVVDDFGRLVEEETLCPGGTICKSKQKMVDYPHKRKTLQRSSSCVYKNPVPAFYS